jgi:transcriptional regulator of arginine metabolism
MARHSSLAVAPIASPAASVASPAASVTSPAALKSARQRAIRELIARSAIGSQQDLVEALRARGMDVTQATVSRDVAELGLIKVTRADRHVYVAAADFAASGPPTSDALLRRLLADIPVRVGRSGLILVLTAPPGTASSIAQAIDQSTLTDQEGTLAGDNTLLVLFADVARLERWLARFQALGPAPDAGSDAVAAPAPDPIGASSNGSAGTAGSSGGPVAVGPSPRRRPQEVTR